MPIQRIDKGSEHLAAVNRLWRAESATLGFFPQGAFEEYATKGGLLGALDEKGQLNGYVAFRRTGQQAVVAHLCVAKETRGKGIARALFQAFQTATSELRGACITCRKDFAAASLWPRLGLVVVDERPAREPGRVLQRWWLDYGHPNLFTTPPPNPLAVIDANVFFDLQSDEETESSALRADWLQAAFTLAVTPELFVEIARRKNPSERIDRRKAASLYQQVCGRCEQVNNSQEILSTILGSPTSNASVSDHRHLAHAVASQADYFVTRDGAILAGADALREQFQIEVVRPAALVSRFDEDLRPNLYSPSRLEGSGLGIRLVHGEEIDQIVSLFQNYPRGETNSGLLLQLRHLVANPRMARVEIVEDEEHTPLALVASISGDDERLLPILRYRAGSLGHTLARHLVWRDVVEAERIGKKQVRFTDAFTPDETIEALNDIGFVGAQADWFKPIVRANVTREVALRHISSNPEQPLDGAGLTGVLKSADSLSEATLERLIWPGKIRGTSIPCYVVPIQPRWAAQLFDMEMASEHLFPAEASLMLRFENAYYRSARPAVLADGPGRILWYVSSSEDEPRSGHIRASSILTSVTIDTAKRSFKRNKRFGVFDWLEVKSIAGGAENELMVFSFSHTKLMKRPLSFATASAVLKQQLDKSYTFQSPVKLPEPVWLELYNLASVFTE